MEFMKKFSLFLGIIIAFTTITTAQCAPNKTINADISTKRIPSGTMIELKLIDPINSANMFLGDQFDLMTIKDIKVDKQIIIPTGSVIRGSIQKVTPRKMLSKGAIVYLDFDHIVSTTGKQVPISLGLCYNQNITVDGGIWNGQNYLGAIKNNAKVTANIVTTSTKWGWQTGEDILEGYPKYILGPIAAGVSAPAAGIYFLGDAIVDLIKKGDDISLNQGDTIKVMLTKSLDMPIN